MIEAYVLLIIFTLFGSLGGFFLKRATSSSAKTRGLLTNWNLYAGFGFYFLSAVINIIVLQMLPYSVVLPCSAITYIWSLYLSRKFLMEKVGLTKIAGVGMIIFGTIIIAFGPR